MTARDREVIEYRAKLADKFKPGDTVYTVLRHVSRSGMQRSVGVVQVNGAAYDWSGWVARLLGHRFDDRRGGVIMGGCGTDMGFEAVYTLGRYLWPDGFDCIGEDRCHSNDHSNGDRNYSPDNHHKDGGYALRQRWI